LILLVFNFLLEVLAVPTTVILVNLAMQVATTTATIIAIAIDLIIPQILYPLSIQKEGNSQPILYSSHKPYMLKLLASLKILDSSSPLGHSTLAN